MSRRVLNHADAKAWIVSAADEGDLSSDFVDQNTAALEAGIVEIVEIDGVVGMWVTDKGAEFLRSNGIDTE